MPANGRATAGGSGLKSVPQEWMGLRCDAYVTDHNSALDTLTRLVSEDGFYDEFIREMATSGDKIPYPHFKSPLIGTVNMIGHMVASEVPVYVLELLMTGLLMSRLHM